MKQTTVGRCGAPMLIAGSLLLAACGGGGSGSSASNTSSSGVSTSSSSGSSSGGGAGGTVGTGTSVLTYHNDSARTGQNLTESVLTPANVNSTNFGLKTVLAADGVVDAAPLVVSGVSINGTAHDVVYVATEHDSVYAYDADSLTLLKQVSLLGSGETPDTIPVQTCNQVVPTIGVTSTGVIDRRAGPNGTLFVVASSQNAGGTIIHRLHALDLADLSDRMPATVVQATYPGGGPNATSGTLTFNPLLYKERSALLLSGGQIYTAWASHCDLNAYNAWIMSYDESTLAQTHVLNLTPNGYAGAIWNFGGLLDDGEGSLYALSGNGVYDAQQDYGNAAVRLSTSGGALTVADYFATNDTTSESLQDVDFGSGSPMLLPDQIDASGVTRKLMVAAGKDGILFVLDRTNMGGFNSSVNQVYQMLSGVLSGSMFSAPAYFNGTLYAGAVGASLQAFTLSQALLPSSATSKTTATFSYPGTTPSISANGSSNAIVWTVSSNASSAAVLHAYNPGNLAQEYYDSTQAGSRDSFGNGNKFVTPVIANGRVFIGTASGVAVFGLL